MQQFLAQLQQLLAAPGGGPVNWDLARQVAASQLTPAAIRRSTRTSATPSRRRCAWPTSGSSPAAALPSGIRTSVAWNRNEWIYKHPRRLAQALRPGRRPHGRARWATWCPPEARAQLGPMQSMVTSLGGAALRRPARAGARLARRRGALRRRHRPAARPGRHRRAACRPTSAPTARAWRLPEDEVRLYVALREAAHQRLFGHVPWLRGHVLGAVETYATGITVNREAIEEAMGRVDPANPESMQAMALEGIFTPEDTPAQQARWPGWRPRSRWSRAGSATWSTAPPPTGCPNVARLAETFRRRRAAGGPAEQTFAALVGLELRPRRLREAAALWAALTEHRGVAGRDALWGHPDLLPGEEDFADPEAFASNRVDLGDLADFDFDSPAPREPGTGDTGEPGTGAPTSPAPGPPTSRARNATGRRAGPTG